MQDRWEIRDILQRMLLFVFMAAATVAIARHMRDVIPEFLMNLARRPHPFPTPPASERVYYLVDLLPRMEDHPISAARWGTCHHLNYEGLPGMGIGETEFTALVFSLSTGGRCVLVYMPPEWAAIPPDQPMSVVRVVRILRRAGISQIVIRVHVRINREMWERMEEIYREAERERISWLEAAKRIYGPWIGVWGVRVEAPGDGSDVGGTSVAEWLAGLGVHVQLYNEPNIMEEWDLWEEARGLFEPIPGTNAHRYRGSLAELGRKVCMAHRAYLRAFFPAAVLQERGEFRYHLSVPQPLMVIPDIALADGRQRVEYLSGCIEAIARQPGMLEYILLQERLMRYAYGFHIYVPCTNGGTAMDLNGIGEMHIAPVIERLQGLSDSGLEFFARIMVTEFGGAFGPGTGCTREKQKGLYAAFTGRFPDIPAFLWVYLGRSCAQGTFDHNSPEYWDRAVLVAWDPAARVFHNCAGAGSEDR
ncbi:hypothetical protein [Thermoflexus sp.]|uniref:hypothetical protein n=1 Tax=Thermoflexus sp. TaxID=1969742 RepID=UPI002ADE49A2|nr:hypothetical protein [Thermoflexus sp.]